jgi:hypothetical protein
MCFAAVLMAPHVQGTRGEKSEHDGADHHERPHDFTTASALKRQPVGAAAGPLKQ